MQPATVFAPGSLVRARRRDWIVEPGSTESHLYLRPLGGSEEDVTALIPNLEAEPVQPATFAPPDPTKRGAHSAALLLRDALQLKLRAGAGPFRSFANIAFEPRAYQLVPLLMALRQPTVRLLIADDVGIGKTIEAGLIARELYDRGEIRSMAVLCPPHLVEQWQSELQNRFHLGSVALTASNVSRLERALPSGVRFFDHYPNAVVSLDYIKSERHRDHFLSIAPDCLIVDEAHTCTTGSQGKQLRFELLRRLAHDRNREEQRHLLLLTATPHSGDSAAFQNLLSLLDPDFAELEKLEGDRHRKLRERLGNHFVQRRRKDINEWHDARAFPRRYTAEITYGATPSWNDFFGEVVDYVVDLAEQQESTSSTGSSLIIWYATLALLRCVSSSPASAAASLRTRLKRLGAEGAEEWAEDRLHDGDEENLVVDDVAPAAALGASPVLDQLIAKAESLNGPDRDAKLATLLEHVGDLVFDGFRPVVFCRYIPTAHYVAEHLATAFSDIAVAVVTGEKTPEERRFQVEELITEPDKTPVLVATDCLAEGINLQEGFDAVVHYDLAWNPTRHEQREGRVDRFGQKSEEVRCSLLYGQDNPVDGLILDVILRKGQAIQKELGVMVPVPANEKSIQNALVRATILKARQRRRNEKQLEFANLADDPTTVEDLEVQWEDALKKARTNRTRFAQRSLKPEEVLPDWEKQRTLIGDQHAIRRFLLDSCARLGAPLQAGPRDTFRLDPADFPEEVRARLAEESIDRPLHLAFDHPPPPRSTFIHRTHPLISALGEYLLESAVEGDTTVVARSSVTVTDAVSIVTRVYLVRLRMQLTFRKNNRDRILMAEEAIAFAATGGSSPQWLATEDASRLLEVTPLANLSDDAARRHIEEATRFAEAHQDYFEEQARSHAENLLLDHRRVRDAARTTGSYSVQPALPVDLIGVYVLLPNDL